MDNVRKTSKTVITLMIFILGIWLLSSWCSTLRGSFFQNIYRLLGTEYRIGGYNSVLLKISFWLILYASGLIAIYKSKNGFAVLGAFAIPLLFSCAICLWAVILQIICIDIRWFWLFYYVAIAFCVRQSFKKLIDDLTLNRIKLFLKSIAKEKKITGSHIDYYTIYVSSAILLAVWFLLVISVIVFTIQYRAMFGL